MLAYADDIVLLSPLWHGLQSLLSIVEQAASAIGMMFNTEKTVCMSASPYDKHKMVSDCFPQFKLAGCELSYVAQFKYLGHIIELSFVDDTDINRELKNLFPRTNVLLRRFSYCSSPVKLQLFKSYCVCFCDIALWSNFHACVLSKLASAYVKCLQLFFGYSKYSSVTAMIMVLGLSSFDTVMHNAIIGFSNRLHRCSNAVVQPVLRVN